MRKVKGNIHWLSAAHAVDAEVRLYDRLFGVPFPGARQPWGVVAEGASAPIDALPEPGHRVVVAGDEEESTEPAERNYLDDLNRESKRVITAYVESALATAAPETCFQFERHGYFVADTLKDHAPDRLGVQSRRDVARLLGQTRGAGAGAGGFCTRSEIHRIGLLPRSRLLAWSQQAGTASAQRR